MYIIDIIFSVFFSAFLVVLRWVAKDQIGSSIYYHFSKSIIENIIQSCKKMEKPHTYITEIKKENKSKRSSDAREEIGERCFCI